jgi:hypothetical protein
MLFNVFYFLLRRSAFNESTSSLHFKLSSAKRKSKLFVFSYLLLHEKWKDNMKNRGWVNIFGKQAKSFML